MSYLAIWFFSSWATVLIAITAAAVLSNSMPVVAFQTTTLFESASIPYMHLFYGLVVLFIAAPSFFAAIRAAKIRESTLAGVFLFLASCAIAITVIKVCTYPFFGYFAYQYTLKVGHPFERNCPISEKHIHPIRAGEIKILFFSSECLGRTTGVKVDSAEYKLAEPGTPYTLKGIESKYGLYIRQYGRADGKSGMHFN